MIQNTKKIYGIFILLAIFFTGYFINTPHVFAQNSTNFGAVVDYKDKIIVENPWGGIGNSNQITQSSCPIGSVLVGFNLYNQGDNYSQSGSLYCQSVALNFGNVTTHVKDVIESPWGGAGSPAQIVSASCPSGSVLVGFNLWNVGDSFSNQSVLYCRQVLSAKPSSSNQNQDINIGSVQVKDGLVVENPWAGNANQGQIVNSSCPSESVLVGFNLQNMGDNFSNTGSLYCSNLTFNTVGVFDFTLSSDGDKTVNIGDIVNNNINIEALSDISKNVALNIDSIKTSSGVNVMNTVNGFTVPANPFTPKTNTVSLSSTGQRDVTPLTLISSPTISVGTYTAKITGTYTQTIPGTSGNSIQYYCKIAWKNNNGGYYFGCSPDSNFDPLVNFQNSPGVLSVECIEGDPFGQNANCRHFWTGFLTTQAMAQISSFRLEYASRVCQGTVNVTSDPNDPNPNNPDMGFTCVISPKPASTQTVVKSTSFNITTRPPVVVINYNLTLTPGNDGCPTPLYIGLTWNAIANATSYNLYRSINGGNNWQTISVFVNPVNGKISTTDSSDSYGSHNSLIMYKVAAIVNGVEIEASPEKSIYSPEYLPQNCITFVPALKLFVKATSNNSINLATYDEKNAITSSNSEVFLYKNETFDLKWATNLPSDYTCTQVTTMPNWSINNSIWNYGSPTNGSTAGLSVASLPDGTYNLRVSCTKGASTISSNTVQVNVIFEPSYSLNVTTSGNQCPIGNIWMRQSWNAVPGATSYRIARSSGPVITYVIAAPTTTNLETNALFVPGTSYTYTVTAIINGVAQTPSAPVTVIAPTASCPVPTTVKLFIRNSNSVALNFGSYTTATAISGVNTAATAVKGLETFDLKWVSDLDNGYTCSPTGSGSGLWPYGATLAGASYNLNTAGFGFNSYSFSVQCTKGASVISSNVVTLTLTDPVVYNLSITSSGNQCDRDNLWVRASWGPIAGASTYTITGTEDSTGVNTRYTIGGRSYLYSFANGTTAFTQDSNYSYSVVAKSNGVAIAPPSPTITIKTPRQDASLCIGSSILLQIKRNGDPDANYSSALTLNKGELYDIRWIVTNPVGTYFNTQTVTGPGGVNASNIWAWGNNVGGSSKNINTDKPGVVGGDYIFSMRYDDYNSSGNPSLNSNQVTLTVIAPVVVLDLCKNILGNQDPLPYGVVPDAFGNCVFPDVPLTIPADLCPNIDGLQNPIPDGLILKANGNCGRLGGGGIEGPDVVIKLFLGDATVITKTESDSISTGIYQVNKGNNFNIAWRSNLPSGYQCSPQTVKSNNDLVNTWSWNDENKIEGKKPNLSTAAAEIDTYSFYLICNDPVNSPLGVLRSNVAKMQVSALPVSDPNPVKLWIGNPSILNNNINTPSPNVGYTYKVRKGETFNLKWASNLGNSFECTPETRKDGQNIATWDWNSIKSNGDKTTGLTTTNVEKGIYSFQLRCSDPSVVPPVASIPSNLVKLQIMESTIIEQ